MTWKGHRLDGRFPTARFAVFTARSLKSRLYPCHVIIRVEEVRTLGTLFQTLSKGFAHDWGDDAYGAASQRGELLGNGRGDVHVIGR